MSDVSLFSNEITCVHCMDGKTACDICGGLRKLEGWAELVILLSEMDKNFEWDYNNLNSIIDEINRRFLCHRNYALIVMVITCLKKGYPED